MTQPREGGDPESQWQQPPFDPAAGQVAPAGQSGWLVVPTNGMGSDLVPAHRRPPTVLESTLRVASGLVWPLFIAASIFGFGFGWGLNIFAAIVASSVLGAISTELRRRRKYLPPAAGELPPAEGDLR